MNALIDTYLIQPVNLVQVLFIGLCLFGAALLAHKPRYWGLCLLLTLETLLMSFNFSEETKLFGQSYLVTPVFTLCTGPAFYLFVRHLVYAQRRWTLSDLVHFIPALFSLPFTQQSNFVIAVGSVSLITYGVIAYLELRKYSITSQALSSAAVDMRLNWLIQFMWVFAVLGITDTIRLNLQSQLGYSINSIWYLLHQTAVMLLYATLIFHAIRQPLLFDGLSNEFDLEAAHKDQTLSIELFEQLDAHIIATKMFRQPRLSLNDIALEFGLGVKDVSSAINQGAEQNLCEYINRLRVEDVKHQISEAKEVKLNFLDIGLNAGFNSKSSFNAVFKSLTGLSPSQYQRTLK